MVIRRLTMVQILEWKVFRFSDSAAIISLYASLERIPGMAEQEKQTEERRFDRRSQEMVLGER